MKTSLSRKGTGCLMGKNDDEPVDLGVDNYSTAFRYGYNNAIVRDI